MIQRIIGILTNPKSEWEKIKAEGGTTVSVLTSYAMILALIPAVAGFIGYSLIGINAGFLGTIRYPITSGIIWALSFFVLTLVGFFIDGIVINALAPSFDSKQNTVNAFKLVVYSMTPAMLGGIFYLLPSLGLLVFLISLYGLYLLFVGMPIIMETPKEKTIGYFIVALIVMIVVNVVVGLIAGAIMSATWRPFLKF